MTSKMLQRQLEVVRLDRGIQVCESLAEHRALLTTAELARLNNITTGTELDPWRQEPVTITLPSGRTETMQLIADPVVTAREKLHRATDLAESGLPLDAAIDIYVGLVLAHVFKDANRRTASLAAHYFLVRYGIPLSGTALHDISLGDLREEGQVEGFRELVKQMVMFAEKKRNR